MFGRVEGLVDRANASLPTKQREVVTLYYIGEQSGREEATFLDLPLTTVGVAATWSAWVS